MEEEKSYQEIRKELIDKYKPYIAPKIFYYNNELLNISNKKRKLITNLFIAIIILILFIIIISYISINWAFITFISEIIIISIFILYISTIIKEIGNIEKNGIKIKDVKREIMPVICNCFHNLVWVPNRTQPTKKYQNTYLIPTLNYINYDDCFVGKYKKVEFIIEELETWSDYTNFKGIIIQFKINKKFKSHTVIHPSSNLNIFHYSKLHRTVLEDIVFEKKYDVYTNDDIEARYLITTSFMKQLNEIKLSFYATQIHVVFKDGIFYLALETNKNLFEIIDFNKSTLVENQYYAMIDEIISILKLIDYFKLDQNIGM